MILATRIRHRRHELILCLALFLLTSLGARMAAQDSPITFRTSSNLVLVDVVALKNGLPVKVLQRKDFELWDNDRRDSIATFDNGVEFKTRPLAIWFVVLCNMKGYEAEGSGLFQGKTHLFQSALTKMEGQDAVGVAHWCDDGKSNLDLNQTKNPDEALSTLERVLAPVPDTESHDRDGELALQATMQLII